MSATLIPPRSLERRMLALEAANTVRIERARLKRDVKAGRVSILDVFGDPPEFVATMRVEELLRAAPHCGCGKVNRIMSQARVSPGKTVGGLTVRQRGEVAALLPACAIGGAR